MDTKTKCVCASITTLVTILVLILAMSFGTVEPTEYGILYNSVSKQIDNETVYEGGLQYVGLFNHVVAYPRIQKTIEFSDNSGAQQKALQTRTQEGLELTLHFAFQYQIQKDHIPELYRLIEQDYEGIFEKIARNTILLQAGEFPAPMYWQNRTFVGNQMLQQLNTDLNQAFANCTGFMFLRIDLPDSYENAIVQTQVVNQQKNTQQAIMNQTIIRTQIEVDRSRAQMDVDIINAQANSEALIIQNDALATMLNNTITYQGWAYQSAQDQIGFTNSSSMLDYIFYINLMNLNKKSDAKLLVGLNDARININK